MTAEARIRRLIASASLPPHEAARRAARADVDPKRLEHFEAMPHVPFGSYVGRGTAHACHPNAARAARGGRGQLYHGYVVSHGSMGLFDKPAWHAAEHSFNVVDGRVVEHTKLHGGGEHHYFGVPIPKAEQKGYGIMPEWPRQYRRMSKLSWVKQQAQETDWFKALSPAAQRSYLGKHPASKKGSTT